MIQKRAHSSGKEDDVQSMICRSHDFDIIIAFFLKYKLRQMYRYKYEYSLVKNLLTY